MDACLNGQHLLLDIKIPMEELTKHSFYIAVPYEILNEVIGGIKSFYKLCMLLEFVKFHKHDMHG